MRDYGTTATTRYSYGANDYLDLDLDLGRNDNACLPGCRLPCCLPSCPPPPLPSRRCNTLSPRRPRCRFIPPPCLSTKRYCGDPCSPPPPRCTPRPERGRFSRARPCPSSYGQPMRPKSCNPCLPRKCSPCDPCPPPPCPLPCPLPCPPSPCPRPRPRLSRCNPCRPRVTEIGCARPTTAPCSPSRCRTSPRSCSPCPPRTRVRRRVTTPCRRPWRPVSRVSSSCCSSYCDSPPGGYLSQRRGARTTSALTRRCMTCAKKPCVCACPDNCSTDDTLRCSELEEASKGPTSWFLKKTGKIGNSKEPHFCPWEADVTVTGTVRGHCTSTAVEVAKRLTGKFVSRGQRYACQKDPVPDCKWKDKCKNQKMTLGYLDDGTKLDFKRKKSPEEGSAACQTNNAVTDLGRSLHPSSLRLPGFGKFLEVEQQKTSGTNDTAFATAYVGERSGDVADKCCTNQAGKDGEHSRFVSTAAARRCEPDRRSERRRHRRHRSYAASEGSETDKSSNRAVTDHDRGRDSTLFSRRPHRSRYSGITSAGGRRIGRRLFDDDQDHEPVSAGIDKHAWRYRDSSSGEEEEEEQAVPARNFYDRDSGSEEWYPGDEDDDYVYNFYNNDSRYHRDDIDFADSQERLHKQSMVKTPTKSRPATSSHYQGDRLAYSRGEWRRKGRGSNSYYREPQLDLNTSSEEDLRVRKSSQHHNSSSRAISRSRHHGVGLSSHSKYSGRRKRITNNNDL